MRVASLHIYPVKGVRALDLDEMDVEPWGPRGDRRWLVVDANGRFVTQREAPVLATVIVRPTTDGLLFTAPGQPPMEARRPAPDAARAQVTVFRTAVDAAAVGGPIQDWLSRLVGEPCRPVYLDRPEAARRTAVGQGFVSFADEYPLLLVNAASLADFNHRAGLHAPVSRFRPNVVVEGATAWAEEGWPALTIGEVAFEVVQGCGRCVVTTIDQQTADRAEDGEPLRSLVRLRRDASGQARFGVHLRPIGVGRVRVTDEVKVAAGS